MMGTNDNESPMAKLFPQEHLHFEDNGLRIISGAFAGDPKLSSKTKEDIYWVDDEGVAHFGEKKGGGKSGGSGSSSGSSGNSPSGRGFLGIALGIIAAIILLMVLIPKFNNPVKKVTKYLNSGNYSAAVELYNNKIYGTEKKENQINSLIEERINACGDEYFDNESDYDTVVQNLTTFEGIKKEEYSKLARSIITSIDGYVVDKDVFDNGIALMGSSDYLNAMVSFLKIAKDSRLYSDATENYNSCQGILLEELADPKTEMDYENYIKKLEEYLEVISTDSAFKNRKTELEKGLAEIQDNALKAEYLADAANAFENEDYTGAFEILNNGLKEFPSDQSIKTKITDYQKQYVDIITAKAKELSDSEKYTDALSLLSDAEKVYACNEFKTLYEEIDEKRAKATGHYEAKDVDFITHKGSIKSENERDTYDLTAKVSGSYGFQTDEMVNGFTITLKVYDSLGKEIHTEYGMTKGSTSSCWLTKGEKYTVAIDERSGTGDYVLYIGQAKEMVDLTSCDVVSDAIEFDGQVNKYKIKAARQGTYHFGFTDIVSGFNLTLRVYDDLDYEIATEYGVSNDGGITATFEEGKEYELYVYQRNGGGKYTMAVGKQTATNTLAVGKQVSGQMTFDDQKNRYDMDLPANTKFRVTLSGMPSGFNTTVRVYDPLDYEIATQYGLANNDFTFTTNSAGSYRITIFQRNGSGNYNLIVNRAE